MSLYESIVQRTIDRAVAAEKPALADDGNRPWLTPTRRNAKPTGSATAKPAGPPPAEWLGSNLGVQVDAKALQVINMLATDEFRSAMQTAAWGNLPILNEWKRRFPDQDPVDVHRRVWGSTLQCPGGGKYVWNEAFATLESTVYGHPGEPKDGPPAPPALSTFRRAHFGITFEHDGLRPGGARRQRRQTGRQGQIGRQGQEIGGLCCDDPTPRRADDGSAAVLVPTMMVSTSQAAEPRCGNAARRLATG